MILPSKNRWFPLLLACMLGSAWTTNVSGAQASFEGRWEGALQIPGVDTTLVLDVSKEASGAWKGSVIIPGRNVSGETLSSIAVNGTELSAKINRLFAGPKTGPATLNARIEAKGILIGDLQIAGNSARFELQRTGPSQVTEAPESTAIPVELEGVWTGEYELNGYPRHVTLALKNQANGRAHADLAIVGKKTTNVPITLVVMRGDFVTLTAPDFGMSVEGKLDKTAGAFKGTLAQGAVEVVLLLNRSS